MRQNKIPACIICFLTIGLLVVASAQPAAFCPSNTCQSRWSLHHRHNIQSTLSWSHHRPTTFTAHTNANVNSEGNGANYDNVAKEQKEILSKVMAQSQIMHAMLAVPDVNATVNYWKSRGATLQSYRKSRKAETAFVGFSDAFNDRGFFSLEIVTLANEAGSLTLGNAISYFGLSMLLDFDLETAAAGESPPPASLTDIDPNGIQVQSVAAAPGDSFSRFCLRTAATGATTDEGEEDVLAKTIDFYEQLGMTVAAGDETCACLRYTATKKEDNTIQRAGVAMTLYFERPDAEDNTDLNIGNCFDHFAFSTLDVDVATEALRAIFLSQGSGEDDDISKFIFMEPTIMFGMKLVGLYDPNGYKVYLVEDPKIMKH